MTLDELDAAILQEIYGGKAPHRDFRPSRIFILAGEMLGAMKTRGFGWRINEYEGQKQRTVYIFWKPDPDSRTWKNFSESNADLAEVVARLALEGWREMGCKPLGSCSSCLGLGFWRPDWSAPPTSLLGAIKVMAEELADSQPNVLTRQKISDPCHVPCPECGGRLPDWGGTARAT